MSKNENRLNFRMTDETAAKIERWYQEDNCRSKNEFIEKAVNCYADMLAAGESTALPRAVHSLSKKSGWSWAFSDRYGRMSKGDERCWNAGKWIEIW